MLMERVGGSDVWGWGWESPKWVRSSLLLSPGSPTTHMPCAALLLHGIGCSTLEVHSRFMALPVFPGNANWRKQTFEKCTVKLGLFFAQFTFLFGLLFCFTFSKCYCHIIITITFNIEPRRFSRDIFIYGLWLKTLNCSKWEIILIPSIPLAPRLQ